MKTRVIGTHFESYDNLHGTGDPSWSSRTEIYCETEKGHCFRLVIDAWGDDESTCVQKIIAEKESGDVKRQFTSIISMEEIEKEMEEIKRNRFAKKFLEDLVNGLHPEGGAYDGLKY